MKPSSSAASPTARHVAANGRRPRRGSRRAPGSERLGPDTANRMHPACRPRRASFVTALSIRPPRSSCRYNTSLLALPFRTVSSHPFSRIGRCPRPRTKMPSLQVFLRTAEPDVAALFERLKEEVRRSGAAPGVHAEDAPGERLAARAEAERLWPVSADRSLQLRPGFRGRLATPRQGRLRKLMRWYVEPLAYDQRSFNAASLRLPGRPRSANRPARGRARHRQPRP